MIDHIEEFADVAFRHIERFARVSRPIGDQRLDRSRMIHRGILAERVAVRRQLAVESLPQILGDLPKNHLVLKRAEGSYKPSSLAGLLDREADRRLEVEITTRHPRPDAVRKCGEPASPFIFTELSVLDHPTDMPHDRKLVVD